MSTMNRMSAKTFFKSFDKYEAQKKLVERAVHPVNPSLQKSHASNRKKLDESFLELCHDWKNFKRDLNVTEEEFNGFETDEITLKYDYNDKWMEEFENAYYDLMERSDAVLEGSTVVEEPKESKAAVETEQKLRQEVKLRETLSKQVELSCANVTAAIDKINSEVVQMIDGGEILAKVQSMKSDLHAIDDKIDGSLCNLISQYVALLDDSETLEKEAMRVNFTKREKIRISNLLIILSKKIKGNTPSTNSGGFTNVPSDRKEQTFLRKIDPPKWDGDPINFADFMRKWKTQVSTANLPSESELDRLRDSIPVQAAKALFGESEMPKAWKLLESLYGDKDLIANKLKSQLKNIKIKAKHDYDVVIELVTDVNNIVLRLQALGVEEMLHVDNEFLSAVYRALPSNSQVEWLKFDKTCFRSKWAGLMKFLDEARNQALQNKVLLCGFEQDEAVESCKICGSSEHRTKKCPKKGVSASANPQQVGNLSDSKKKEMMQKEKALCGKCPLCKDRHSYFKSREKEYWPSDRLFKCDKFKGLTIRERADTLEKFGCCSKCTSWNHKKDMCKSAFKCVQMVSGSPCNKEHSSMVCGSGNAYCGSVRPSLFSSSSCSEESSDSDSSSDSSSSPASISSSDSLCSENFPDLNAETLLMFQDVKISGADSHAHTCWDKGSTRCLVTHSFAQANGLQKQKIVFKLDVVGSLGEPQDGWYYMFEMVRNNGTVRKVWGYGIETIMESPDPLDLSSVRSLFPHIPKEVFAPSSKKPVDILMGNNFLGLHPDGGIGRDAVGDMRAYQSQFGLGWVLAGTHPDIKPGRSMLSVNAVNLARIFKCEVVPELLPSFWEGECLGVLPPKRCGKCLRCSQCSDPGLIHSRKEQEELEMLENSVKLENGQIHVTYPFSRDPYCLPNNRRAVVKMAEKQEARLIKSGQLEYYNKEFQKYLDRGAAVKLTKQEIDEWQGPVNYISHHGVVQDSVTTPLRIVTNSSLKNGTTSLNECLVKGPKSLNSMLDITIRFRCHEEGMVFDLTKAYNALKTGPVEKHLRRFVWRFHPDEEWADYAFDCVAFGDLPAANLLEIGRNMTADDGQHIDPEAARKIKDDSYVDDNVSGGTTAEVNRMQGVRLSDGTFSGTMRQILDRGKLKQKVMVRTGETDEEVKHLIGNKVFGYKWNATTDMMGTDFNVYLTNKKRKMRSQPALTLESLKLLETSPLTKRICLGITNGFLDFLGISCPFTLRFKLLMRQFFENQNQQLKWEDRVPGDMVGAWQELIAEAVKSSSLCFPRCVRPAGAVGKPLVVDFSDGAFPAFCAAIYLQWQIACLHGLGECPDDYEASLLLAKARVTPLTGYTVPRSELSGTVLGSRMAVTTVKALQSEPSMQPKGVIQLSDSKCTISAVDTSTRALKPFFHNRVSEIVENMTEMRKYCPVEEIHYVASNLNPADVGTRGFAKVADLGPDSFWQRGPAFLCSRRDLWPVSRDFVREEVPDDEVRGKTVSQPVFCAWLRATYMSSSVRDVPLPDLWHAVLRTIQYSNNLDKVLRILAMVIVGWKMKSEGHPPTKKGVEVISAVNLEAAEKLLLLSAMPETVSAAQAGKLVSLNPEKAGAIIVTSGRIGEESLSRILGVPYLPILMASSRASYLYMVRAHEGEFGTVHCSVAETLARSREKVWIVRAKDLCRKVVSGCHLCRRRGKQMAGQQMGKIKKESLTICRPWTHIALDFAGPLLVKGAVNARAKKKCWILVYVCRSTKAVELLATLGYDTGSFLLRHEEFVARHSAPATIVSDRGTQLVSAGRILAVKAAEAEKESPSKWDWSRITRENCASNWQFVPIGSPHFNGLPEATVKVLKKSLSLALPPGVELNYPELVTLLARISYTVNSRPLGLANVSQSDNQEDIMMPITPNMMLLSRSSSNSPPMEYSPDDKFCARLSYVAQVEKEWWDRWIKTVLPTLFSYKRWKTKQRNLEIGELVMLKYPGQFKDDYCIAKVTEVHPSEDGLVRQVTVEFKKKNSRESPSIYKSKPLIQEKVAVHRLHRLQLVDEDAHLGAEEDRDEAAVQTVGSVSHSVVQVGAVHAQCESEG